MLAGCQTSQDLALLLRQGLVSGETCFEVDQELAKQKLIRPTGIHVGMIFARRRMGQSQGFVWVAVCFV